MVTYLISLAMLYLTGNVTLCLALMAWGRHLSRRGE
jgi:hypothetical protein